jgi:phospho-2-dehydro-3-deoxyheptonate aldolase
MGQPVFVFAFLKGINAYGFFIFPKKKEVIKMSMTFHRKLPIPQEVKKEFALTNEMAEIKANRDKNIKAVFEGESDKFILIIGPCSADHREPVLEYISRLSVSGT